MRPRVLLALAFVVSLVATVWSVSLSGIGPLGWRGLGLFPCELCWYQRILMYPIPVLLAVGLVRRDERAALYVLPLAVPGFLVAAYHTLIQSRPSLETQGCFVGSCTRVDWRFLDLLTVPQLSALAFALVVALGALSLHAAQRRR